MEISDDEEGDHSESDVQLAVPISATVTVAGDVSDFTAAHDSVVVHGLEDTHHSTGGERKPHVDKKSKKNKRLEKEELKEREKKALALKQRITAQNMSQSVPLAVECVGSHPEASATATATAAHATDATAGVSAITSAEGSATSDSVAGEVTVVPEVHVSVDKGAKAQSCNTCGGQFFDVKDYRNHFRFVVCCIYLMLV